MALHIADYFRGRADSCENNLFSGLGEQDIFVISNACISGVSAIVAARRLILSGRYDNVAVAGVDVQNRFITSGFASFKSLSPELCRPYDRSRCGLNLGEACGAMLLTSDLNLAAASGLGKAQEVVAVSGGAASDDANHISGPSRTGDGLYFAMRKAMAEAGLTASEIGMLQMHGTATAYNDEMESKAASLCGLQNVPVQSLKPYFGHTMGASGVIETIIAAEELKAGIFAGTLGFEGLGVPMPLNVSAENRQIKGRHCLKTASGFGGTNAAVVISLREAGSTRVDRVTAETSAIFARKHIPLTIRTVKIIDKCICVDGKEVFKDDSDNFSFHDFIREAHRRSGDANPKFYKMDDLCRLGYVACGLLLDGISFGEEECAVVISGKYGCLDTDMHHQQVIDADGDASASPSVFVYTLPNVAAAEISIRHHVKGENVWFCSDDRQLNDIRDYAGVLMDADSLRYCVAGHLDFINGNYFAKFELLGAEPGKSGSTAINH